MNMKKIAFCLTGCFILLFLLSSCNPGDNDKPTVSDTAVTPSTESAASQTVKTTESSVSITEELPEITIPAMSDIEYRFKVSAAFPGIDFVRPLDLQNANDESARIFVVEQSGMIWVISGPGYDVKELFLDISMSVDSSGNEMGLLGLAFHPGFKDNGRFYINYTDSNQTVIAGFTAHGNYADIENKAIILSFDQPYRNHNGGQLAFGPDGYLYIAVGDGGSSGDPLGHGQDLSTLHGSILRIDVDEKSDKGSYAVPADNPFADNTHGYREEIFAYGLRNPWRFSFDPLTGIIWAADVGQNTVEEINIIKKGGNYGWNIMEGSRCFSPRTGCDTTSLELPVFEYLHPLGRSITGGYVYRGSQLPALYGAYIYADYITGLIWGLWYVEGKEPVNYILADTDLNISSFGVDEEGDLYITAFDGKIYRIVLK